MSGQVLHSIAYNAVAPSFAAAASAAEALETAVAAYAAAVGTEDEANALAAARAAWSEAMVPWQVVEQMQLGPAASWATGVGGDDKRDEVYSWPSVNPCRIDQEIVSEGYASAGFVDKGLVNTYGFDALEYLLFYAGETNSCGAQLSINAEGQWDALGISEVQARRAAYAKVVAATLATETSALAAVWSADGGEFTVHLSRAGEEGSVYESRPKGLDEVVRAMFYIDLRTKDAKVAVPAGILDCVTAPCIGELESSWARQSKEFVVANLVGFQMLFHGGSDAAEHVGFDDLLATIGHEELATKMTQDISTAIEVCSAVEGTFAAALGQDAKALHACHAAIVDVTDSLKGDFSTLLMLTIPGEAAGDAD